MIELVSVIAYPAYIEHLGQNSDGAEGHLGVANATAVVKDAVARPPQAPLAQTGGSRGGTDSVPERDAPASAFASPLAPNGCRQRDSMKRMISIDAS